MTQLTHRLHTLARTTTWTSIGLGAVCSLFSLHASAQAEWPVCRWVCAVANW